MKVINAEASSHCCSEPLPLNSDEESTLHQPDDVQVQIDQATMDCILLPRLNIKPLMRFKSVCRLWNELFSTSYFADRQLHYSKKGLIVLQTVKSPFFLDYYGENMYSLPLRGHGTDFVAYGSCNGIVFVKGFTSRRNYSVYNPIINKVSNLPVLPPLQCDISVAFGFVSSTKEYKAVRITTTDNRNEFCKIYTVGSHCSSWRSIGSLPNFDKVGILHPPLRIGGIVHWLRTRRRSKGCIEIISLDLETESFSQVELPLDFSTQDLKLFLLEWDGCLSITKVGEEDLEIWVLEDFIRLNWRLELDVSLESLGCSTTKDFIRPLAVRAAVDVLFLVNQRQIVAYNVRKNILKALYEIHDGILSGAHTHVSSLMWVN